MTSKSKIKEALQRDMPAWDAEALWPKIEAELPKSRKNRAFFWIFIACICALVVYWSFQSEKEEKDFLNQEDFVMTNKSASKTNENVIVGTCPEVATIINDVSTSQITNRKLRKIETDDAKLFSKVSKYENYSPAQLSDNVEKIFTRNKDNSVFTEHADQNLNLNNLDFEPSDTQTEKVKDQKSDDIMTVNDWTTMSIAPIIFQPESNHKPIFSIPSILPDVNHQIGRFDITFITGFFYTNRNIDSDHLKGINFSEYKQRHEKIAETLSNNLLVAYKYGNLRLSTGIHWDRTTEWFVGQDVTVTSTKVLSDSAFILQHNGLNTYYSGYITQTQTTGKNIKSPNLLSRWNIPIEVGFTLEPIKKIKLHPYIGFNFNFISNYSGITIDENLDFIYKDAFSLKKLYKPSGVHSFYTGLNVDLYSSGSLTLFSGFRFQFDISSVIHSEYRISQQYSLIGGTVGFRKAL
ncbi:MAG: hypothetical protein IPM42_02695 [Saprospiraceae bacterium]|nr:hypothetical protein [Saprospiraceae bacterium]